MLNLNSKYLPLYENETRYFIVTGGRGSGKSFEVGAMASTLSFQSGHKILFTRQTMTSAHLSIIPEFQEKIDLMEANDLSIRQKGVQNRIVLILNPATKEHWIYKRFFESEGITEGFNGTKGNVTYIHTTYLDNIENLDQSFINEIEKIREGNPKKYKHVILGGWLDKAEGVVFTNWRFGEFNPDNLQTSFGQDYGFSIDPTTLVEVAIDKTKKIIYVKEHLYKPKLTTSEIVFYNKNIARERLIIADSAEPRLIAEMAANGCNIIPTAKGPGSITAGLALMQDYTIIVDEASSNIAKEFNNYVYSDKKSGLVIDNWNHSIDAIRYNVFFNLSNPERGKYHIY